MPALFKYMNTQLIVLYDSIFNSVFESQVVTPLVKQLDVAPATRAHIVSFERPYPTKHRLKSVRIDPRIELHLYKKLPFFGTVSLRYAVQKLRTLLKKINPTTITARGPLAGWIVAHATDGSVPVIAQARGLAAQEYLYAHQPASGWYHFWHRWRARHYEAIERFVYGSYAHQSHVTIHAVSDALKEYLQTKWHAPQHKIVVATHDIPPSFSLNKIKQWRATMRRQLTIPANSYVYVYSGSAHAWQCPEQTIQFFADAYHKNKRLFLLILTQNSKPFIALLQKQALPAHVYHITQVPHAEIYHYLAVADAGLLFREAHCINWVARPTKVLEYRAVGLEIIHNSTVGMLYEGQISPSGMRTRLHETNK